MGDAPIFFCPGCGTLRRTQDIVHVTDGVPCRATGQRVRMTPEQILNLVGDVREGWVDVGEDHAGIPWRAAADSATLEGSWVPPARCHLVIPPEEAKDAGAAGA